MTKNLSQFKQTMENIPADFIVLQEIWKPHKPYVQLPEYHEIITKTRNNNKKGGGVGIYVATKHKYENYNEINNLNLKVIEAVGVKVTLKNTQTNIISIYRPPNSNSINWIEDLQKILETVGDSPSVICGDINIDTANITSNLTKKYYQIIQEHNMSQYVKGYTRLTLTSKTIIDHTISNIQTFESIVTHHAIADHQLILSCWGKKIPNNEKKEITDKIHKQEIQYEKTATKIEKFNWKQWLHDHQKTNTNEAYNSFDNIIQSCLVWQKTTLNKKGTPKMPYINKEILEKRTKVEKARKKFLKKGQRQMKMNLKQ